MSPSPEQKLPIDPDVVDQTAPLDILLVIAGGGAVGASVRLGIGEALPHGGNEFPWGTFLVNVSGCFALGLLMVWLVMVRPESRYLRAFLGVGFLGGYTTFSTYALEAHALAGSEHVELALLYVVGSVLAGLTAVWLGIVSAEGALSRRRSAPTPEGEAW